MGLKTEEIPVYPIGVFCNDNKQFWLNPLDRILELYPFLEYPHRQAFYMLLCIDQAEGTVTVDQQRIRIDQSKIICIKPNSISSIDIKRAAVGQIICFTESFFSLRYNNNVLYQFSFLKKDAEPFTRLSYAQSERWWQILKLLEQESNIASKGTDKVVRSYLNILLYELERIYRRAPILLAHNLKTEKVQQLERLIEEHYKEKKRPSDYARLLCISPNYLNKICKEETGQTAGELIRKRIIIEAQRLLYYTNYSVNEVANELGFDNASYFVTFFKKNTDQTTEQFRKNQYC